MLLENKRLLITGVLTEASIAWSVARLAQEQGAELVLTGFGRGLRLTERVARRLPHPPDVLELDVTREEDIAAVAKDLDARWGRVDGLLHAVAFAPQHTLGGGFLTAPWPDVATAVHVSAYSFVAMGRGFGGLLARSGGGSLVGLDFDATVAWPAYDWMGVAKSALEGCCRYLARDLGARATRVNLVAAGPLHTAAARAIPGAEAVSGPWAHRAPLGWDLTDSEPVARVVCALLSDWMPTVTGEIVHADGGVHAVGAAPGPTKG
ncbi:enoyl-ACP reductase FabI [Streptomyces olivochromogenes]|uniref:enoyl-ACP reductase FabI n=1 Tax=Streptomyces olivochromogenes TaxID=1963 RepID=UPI001F3D9057|nr:enoyl-ACP reductase FabI [Streptomyces olivochromogenes]MCF3131698.1 enoyl-ACP reductase FabI [Streptomyces olivochromogenes]